MGTEFAGESHQDNKIYIVDGTLTGMPEEKVSLLVRCSMTSRISDAPTEFLLVWISGVRSVGVLPSSLPDRL